MGQLSIRDILQRKLILSIVLTTLLMVLIIMSVTAIEMSRQINEEKEALIDIVERQIEHNFEDPYTTMALVQTFYEEGSFDMLQSFYDKDTALFEYSRVDILDDEGIVTDSVPLDESRIGFDLSRSEGFRMIQGGTEDYMVGNMMFDSAIGHMVLYVTIRLEDGYLVGYFPTDRFRRILEEINVKDGYIAITDRKGYYVAHTNQQYVEERRIDEYVKTILNGQVDNTERVRYAGEIYYLTYRTVGISDMHILYYQDESVYRDVIVTTVITLLILLIVFIPILIIVVTRVVNRIQMALDRLTAATQSIAGGDYTYESEDSEESYIEMVSLIENFQVMSEEIHNREEEISSLNIEIENNYYTTISLMAKAIEAKDQYTGNHCERVRDFAVMIGKGIGLDEDALKQLRYGSILHDIGKLGVSESVLNKPGRLTDEEYELIKGHSQMGYDILSEAPLIQSAKDIILYHHESYDGRGYPAGLRGDEIPLLARIVTIADAYDAMTSKRPYRVGVMTSEEAVEEVQRWSGKQFDPKLVEVFVSRLADDTR